MSSVTSPLQALVANLTAWSADKKRLTTDLSAAQTLCAEQQKSIEALTARATAAEAAQAELVKAHAQELGARAEDFATLKARKLEAEAQLTALSAALNLESPDATKALAALEQKISSGVIEQVAELGVRAEDLPPPSKSDTPAATLAEIQAQMSATKDPALLGQLAQKANALAWKTS